MERELFDYESSDNLDFLEVQYYECTLKRGICNYREGDQFPVIAINYDHGTITFYKDKIESIHHLKLDVVP